MSRLFTRLSFPLLLAGLLGSAASAQAQTTFFGPTPYVSTADRPAGFANGAVLVEDFEDGIVDPALTINGSVIGPGGLTDSVDADDGVIDGSGSGGRSAFSGGSADVSFGAPFPTSAGMVWTDGGTPTDVTFEAFGPTGTSLGTHGPFTRAMRTTLAAPPRTASSARKTRAVSRGFASPTPPAATKSITSPGRPAA